MQLEFGGQRFSVAAGDFVIGSDQGASLWLAGPGIHGRHALVRRTGDAQLVVLQANPEAEIRVNGARIGRDPTPLMHGDRIGIGDQEIRVSDPELAGQTQVRPAAAVPTPSPAVPPTRSARSGPVGRLVSLTDGREYPLDTVPFVFGRDVGAQVVVASPDASRRHAEIQHQPEGDVLVDLSANGTHLNGTRISGSQPLKALDVIRIGADEFRYYPPPPGSATKVTADLAAPAGAEYRLGDTLMGIPSFPKVPAVGRPEIASKPLALLLVRRGAARGDRLRVTSPVVNLGRAEYNDIRLPDPSVSASHAKLELREGVWILSDQGSTNGTSVDGTPITDETALSPGAVIALGEVELLFEPRDEAKSRTEATVVLPRAAEAEPAPPAATPPPAASVEREPSAPPRREPGARHPSPEPPKRSNVVALAIGLIVVVAAVAVLAFLL